MATTYVLNYTDEINTGKTPITVAPGQIDTTHTSISLSGQGLLIYGEAVNENFLRMLENFASPTPPANPTVGQIWFNSATSSINVCTVVSGVGVGTWEPLTSNSDLLAHAANFDLHLTPFENALLDGINSTITSADINALDGITGNIQTQITNVSSSSNAALTAHENDFGLHLTAFENTLLDGIVSTLTSTEINTLDGVTSNIQTQLDTKMTQAQTDALYVNKFTGTAPNSIKWNGGTKTVSTAGPSGGVDGDVWFQRVN